jgi:excisionase family DNA binding protein
MEDMMPRAAVLRRKVDSTKSGPMLTSGLLTVAEACGYLRISKWTLYRFIQAGKLKTVKIGSRRLIRMQSILEFVEQHETAVGA